jgi:ornithine cyclodeaminase
VAAYGEPCFTNRELAHLGAIAAGDASGRSTPDEITFYLSTGLAGSEVVLASRLLEARRERGS